MNVIVIPVGQGRPEDEVLNLVDSFKSLFPGQSISVSDALVIETDIPAVAAIFKQIAGQEIKTSSNGVKPVKRFVCVDCGAPAGKEGGRCKACAMKLVGLKNSKRLQAERLAKEQEETA